MNIGRGWKRQKLKGRDRLYMRTYDSANGGGPNNARLALYYDRRIRGRSRSTTGRTASPPRVAAASRR